MHHIHDDVETALAEHTRRPDSITDGHTGRGLARQRAWAHGHHDQTIHAFCPPRAVLALEPAGAETSEDVEDDPDRISKIRARHDMRNKLVVTAMVADRRASATREQEVRAEKWVRCPDTKAVPRTAVRYELRLYALTSR